MAGIIYNHWLVKTAYLIMWRGIFLIGWINWQINKQINSPTNILAGGPDSSLYVIYIHENKERKRVFLFLFCFVFVLFCFFFFALFYFVLFFVLFCFLFCFCFLIGRNTRVSRLKSIKNSNNWKRLSKKLLLCKLCLMFLSQNSGFFFSNNWKRLSKTLLLCKLCLMFLSQNSGFF